MHSRENVRRSLVALIIPNLAPTNMTPDEIVQRAFDIAESYLKHTGSSEAGHSQPADDDKASGGAVPPSAPDAAQSDSDDEATDERIKDMLFDPAYINAMELGEDGDTKLAVRIRNAIRNTTTAKDAERLAALMRESKNRRREMESKELFTALSTEARDKIDSLS